MRQRLIYVSELRVIALLCVVFYHSICCYGMWSCYMPYATHGILTYQFIGYLLNGFRMPIFTLVSGYLYSYLFLTGKYQNTKEFIINKIRRILIPYVVVGCIILVILPGEKPIGFIYGLSHLWYLIFIFECFIMVRFIPKRYISNPPRIVIPLLVLWAICGATFKQNNDLPFMIEKFFSLGPYFYIGVMFQTSSILKTSFKKTIPILMWGSIALILLVLIIASTKATPFSNGRLMLIYRMLCSIAGITFFLYYKILRENAVQTLPIITKLDKRSMGIYILHHIIIQILNSVEPFHTFMIQVPYVYPIFIFFTALSLSVLAIIILQRYRFSKYIIG